MPIELWFTYVTTVLIFMSTPGPSQLLIVSNSLGHGFGRSTATVAGDLSANVLQMLIASLGLVSILYTSQSYFLIMKWLGVAYLLYMGVRQFFSREPPLFQRERADASKGALYWQGFITSAANPTAIIFFAALFPQFVDASQSVAIQFLVLGATYLVIDGAFLSLYGSGAGWIAKRAKPQMMQHLNKVSGALLIGTAVLLGLRRVRMNRP